MDCPNCEVELLVFNPKTNMMECPNCGYAEPKKCGWISTKKKKK